MKKNIAIITSLSAILSTGAFAGAMGATQEPYCVGDECRDMYERDILPKAKVITFSLGPSWSQTGTSQTFFLQEDIQKHYEASHSKISVANGTLFLGIQKQLSTIFFGQAGVALSASNSANLSGEIWEDASFLFNNYTYTYQIQHYHVAAKGELLVDVCHSFRPYVNGSIGMGVNKAHNFTITPDIYEEVPHPLFQSNNTTSVVYTLGFGAKSEVYEHWQAGIGYEFASWGNSQLGRAPGQTLNSGLGEPSYYTNSIQLSLSYIA